MTRYDPDWVRSFYNEYGEKEWKRWDESPVEQIKFEVHLYYLRNHLQTNDRILEIGAGPGRFTRELAKISKRIVVADISPVQLQLNQDNAHKWGFSDSVECWVECDVCDLRPHFREEEFDAVVCYGGPLSYVFDEREKALRGLLYVTKPRGLLFLSVMSLWGTVHHFLPQVLQVNPTMNKEIIASGDLGPDKIEASRHFHHMYRAAEFRAFLEKAGLIIEALSASDCLSATWGEHLKTLKENEAIWQHLLEMEIEACREPGLSRYRYPSDCRVQETSLIATVKRGQ